MKSLKTYVQERTGRGKIVKKYRVPSKSEPGAYHIVEVDENGKMFCDCIGFAMSKKPKICKHINLTKLWISKDTTSG